MLGIGVIVGVGGLTELMEIVLVIGQFTVDGVTVTEYWMVMDEPGAAVGCIMVFWTFGLFPAKNMFGDQV
jgi:hypothetical protein